MLTITPAIQIPDGEFEFTFARSSGPGGQNVNKVNSKAVLRWSVDASPSLTEAERSLLRRGLAPRLTQEGGAVISRDPVRDQGRNREDCLAKLREPANPALIP